MRLRRKCLGHLNSITAREEEEEERRKESTVNQLPVDFSNQNFK